jgi:hypothetical protein
MASQSGPHQASGRGPARPGTPSLLRELNDRAALELLLDGRSLTRSQLSELTGVSKVTVAQMLTRLQERGLVAAVGSNSGGRGPNAVLYSVVPSSAYVAALYVEHGLVSTAVADVTGRVTAGAREDTNGDGDPVELVRSAVDRACQRAGVSVSALSAFVIGSPGVVDPLTGDPRLAINLPAWHEGVLAGLRGALHRNVLIENDVNLAAMAEHAAGAAAGADDFVLLWLGVGVGLATVLGGRLHRGASGTRFAPWRRSTASAPRGRARASRSAPPSPIPGSEPGGSSTSWPAAWRSARSRRAPSSTPAWWCSAARLAWPAGRHWRTGWRPKSPGSARSARGWYPPPSPANRCCAARC